MNHTAFLFSSLRRSFIIQFHHIAKSCIRWCKYWSAQIKHVYRPT